MSTNNFLTFASGTGANVIDQATYASLTSLVSDGFVAGFSPVPSSWFNKILRQPAAFAAALGEILAANGVDALDDGSDLAAAIIHGLAVQMRGVVSVYNTPGSYVWTFPAGVYTADVQAWGGGGGGKGWTSGGATTGGAGGYVRRLVPGVPGDTISIALNANTLDGVGLGIDGGDVVITGPGGVNMTAGGGFGTNMTGGTASGGEVNIEGQSGIQLTSTTPVAVEEARGGSAPFGGRGGIGAQPGQWPGGGGGTFARLDTQTSAQGAGAYGGVIIYGY